MYGTYIILVTIELFYRILSYLRDNIVLPSVDEFVWRFQRPGRCYSIPPDQEVIWQHVRLAGADADRLNHYCFLMILCSGYTCYCDKPGYFHMKSIHPISWPLTAILIWTIKKLDWNDTLTTCLLIEHGIWYINFFWSPMVYTQLVIIKAWNEPLKLNTKSEKAKNIGMRVKDKSSPTNLVFRVTWHGFTKSVCRVYSIGVRPHSWSVSFARTPSSMGRYIRWFIAVCTIWRARWTVGILLPSDNYLFWKRHKSSPVSVILETTPSSFVNSHVTHVSSLKE